MAFFAILIQKIVESDTLHLPHALPRFVQKLGLCVPDKLSSFRCFVSRHTDKAFAKGQYTELSVIPAPLQPKPSLIGPLCEDAGISEMWLFNSEDVYTGQATITISLLLELILVKKVRGVSDIQCSVWVQRLFHLQYLPHPGTIRRQWERISVRVSNLRGKIKKKERDDYLHLPYLPPSKSVQTSVHEKEDEKTGYEKANDNVPSNDSATTREMVDQDTQCSSFPTLIELASIAFKRSAVVNEMDIRNIENEFELGKMQLTVLQEQVQCAASKLYKIKKKVGHYNTKNVYKRDKRAMATRDKLDNCLKEVESLKANVVSLEKKKKNALKLLSKWKLKKYTATECNTCDTNNSKISKLNESIHALENENVSLLENVSDMSNKLAETESCSMTIETKQVRDGHVGYSDNIRLVYMELLSLGVSVAKCSEVVKTVLTGLTECQVEKLPAKSTTSGFQSECETVAQMHVADVILQSEDMSLSLDGTKKKFREYGSFQVTRSNPNDDTNQKETLSIGIQEMARGDTASFVETLSLLFKDLAEIYTDDADRINQIQAEMVVKVKNLMTDRHIVNKTFKEKFEEYRRDLFEKHLQDFRTLPQDQQDRFVKLHGLYCGLHVLANMGTAASKALKIYEDISLPESSKITSHSFNKGNARSFDLIFEISQSMTDSGNQRFGRLADWDAFLYNIGETNRIVSFLRHRFNVLFVDGAAIYYHRQHIANFLETLPSSNTLLLCIKDSIHSPVCLAALRALGIIAVLVTQPLWRVVERQDIHIFDLNHHWLHLEISLRELATDATTLLQGASIFQEFQARKDDMFEELFKPVLPEVHNLTKECLELLCFHMHSLVKRQVEDQLPGGKYANPTPDVLKATKSCPTSNRAGEKDFSDLDREVNRAPQRFTSHISGTICYRNNKTWHYFRSLPPDRRSTLMVRAMKLAPLRRKRNRERQNEVKIVRKRFIDEMMAKKEAKLQKDLKLKKDLQKRIEASGGIWVTAKDVKRNMSKQDTKGDQTKALKDQLRYHQLHQPELELQKKTLTQFSAAGVQFGVDKLTENLITVLGLTSSGTATDPSAPSGEQISCLRPQEQRLQLLADHRDATISKLAHKARPVAVPVANKSSHQKMATKIIKKAVSVSLKRSAASVTPSPVSKSSRLEPVTFFETSMDTFVAVAFDDGWYLGQVEQIISPEEATIKYMKRVGQCYFQWPSPPDLKATKSIFILKENLCIAPRDSGLRIWRICSTSTMQLDKLFKHYKAEYLM